MNCEPHHSECSCSKNNSNNCEDHVCGSACHQDNQLNMPEKLDILLNHWIEHNESHKDNFLAWAQKAKNEGMEGVSRHIEEASLFSEKITKALNMAKKALEK